MGDWFLGEIRLFAVGYAPKGWAACNGQMLKVTENQALFAIIGNKFGGDGKATFQLPNLQGKAVIHPTTDAAIPVYATGGSEQHVLTINEIPAHTHTVSASSDNGTKGAVAGNTWSASSLNAFSKTASGNMSFNTIGITGASQAHNNMQPYAVANFCIAIEGTFPQRQ
ncbi:tail fiber protein [Paenibacillus algorifonticola]|uniref:phage tail protein n=1 Tax=Paenibacillus algorifonticola TaxID=684063 RepID=UPI003D2B3791